MDKYDYIAIEDFIKYSPFDWNSPIDAFNIHIKDDKLYDDAYSIHLWQTMLDSQLVKYINEDFFDKYDNWFTRKFRIYLNILILS